MQVNKVNEINGLGMNVYLNHYDKKSIKKLLNTLILLKISWIRLEICSKKYNDPVSLEALSDFVKLCKFNKIVVVGLFSDFIPLTSMSVFFSEKLLKPIHTDVDRYLIFVNEIVKKLSSEVCIWEIWNEQNTRRFWGKVPSSIEYTEFVKKIATEIRGIKKDAKIMFGGIFGNDVDPVYRFIPNSIIANPKYIHEAINHKVGDYVDYYAFHPYTRECYFSLSTSKEIAKSIIDSIKKTQKYYTGLPLIVSEIGVSPVLNLRLNSKEIAKIYHEVINFCLGINLPVCIYALSDQSSVHYGILNPDRNFGFLDYHLNVKQLLKEFKNLAI